MAGKIKDPRRKALKVPAFNKGNRPIDYPRRLPGSLSPDAQHLYRWVQGSDVYQRVERDPFDTSRVRYVPESERVEYVPDERFLSAVAELVEAGLGDYSDSYSISLAVTHVAKDYTVSVGRGSHLVKVFTSTTYGTRERLLAVLVGADLDLRTEPNGMTTLHLDARHESAQDFEHDASHAGIFKVINPAPLRGGTYGRLETFGTLVEAKAYPLGVDPLVVGDGDTAPRMCRSEHCAEPHPFAAFHPPVVDSLSGKNLLVMVEAYPIKPYLVAEPPPFDAPTQTTTEETDDADD